MTYLHLLLLAYSISASLALRQNTPSVANVSRSVANPDNIVDEESASALIEEETQWGKGTKKRTAGRGKGKGKNRGNGKAKGRGGGKDKGGKKSPPNVMITGSSETAVNGVYKFVRYNKGNKDQPLWTKRGSNGPNSNLHIYYSTRQSKWFVNDAFDDTGYETSSTTKSSAPAGIRWLSGTLKVEYTEQDANTPLPPPIGPAPPPPGQTSSPDCEDLPSALDGMSPWDDGSNGCSVYVARENWCKLFGDRDLNGAGKAKDACCGCGGGRDPAKVGEFIVIGARLPDCSDLPSALDGRSTWTDGSNGCDAFEEEKVWCSLYGAKNLNGAGSALDMCCACGGGRSGAMPTPAPIPETCDDLPSRSGGKWTDGLNDCDAYVADVTWCQIYGVRDFSGNGRALDVCCACGGGIKSGGRVPAPRPLPRKQLASNRIIGIQKRQGKRFSLLPPTVAAKHQNKARVNKHGQTCNKRCGDPFDSHAKCQCGESCVKFHNCCGDYEKECADFIEELEEAKSGKGRGGKGRGGGDDWGEGEGEWAGEGEGEGEWGSGGGWDYGAGGGW